MFSIQKQQNSTPPLPQQIFTTFPLIPTKPAQQLKTVVTPEVQITNILGPRNDSQNSINLTNRKTNNNAAQNGNATTISSNKQFNTSNQAPSQFQKNSVNSASNTSLTNNYSMV